jgi:hypothetical protein
MFALFNYRVVTCSDACRIPETTIAVIRRGTVRGTVIAAAGLLTL